MIHQRSPYEEVVADPGGYLVPATPMNIDKFTQNMLADSRRQANGSFRQRLLDPHNRRSTNIIDISGPNLNVPVPLRPYPDSLWYDPFKLAPGQAGHDLERAQIAAGKRRRPKAEDY